jgi:predicted 3-demethylubiquinone-9 3-methyltransferase (glyoxalase superfamily)
MTEQRKVRTCLWFARRGIDAAQFYVDLLPDSRIDAVLDHGQPDDPLVVEFTLAGAPMMILTAGDMFQHSPAASISVLTKDQAETDRLWSALLADGGKESMCGWLATGSGCRGRSCRRSCRGCSTIPTPPRHRAPARR